MTKRRLRSTAGALLSMVLVLGCSEEGQVVLRNGTGWPATGVLHHRLAELDSAEALVESIEFGRFPSWGEKSRTVPYEFDGWTAFPRSGTLVAEPNASRGVACAPDAGCIGVENRTGAGLVESVFLASAPSSEWGAEQLRDFLYPGDAAVWTVSPGAWDLRVTLTSGEWVELRGTHVALDQVVWVVVSAGKTVAQEGAPSEASSVGLSVEVASAREESARIVLHAALWAPPCGPLESAPAAGGAVLDEDSRSARRER